ncbi:hypothetical protein JFL43_17735 [Viridibacillus sp. YIM B01967]|uniref:Sporulation protein n=1 Tax=Viridibacillus soli TaxID=2798301 RepID=A0ABS1HCG6_9BACL|nr:hypothetical protein [Viridibacillus soli]MBK3496668.1 hypothetical protein [Viridibacillus soli]
MMKFANNMLFKLSMVVSIVMLSFFSVFAGTTKALENENVSEEVALLAISLNLIFEKGIVTDEKGYTLGYDKEIFENELKDHEGYEEIIQQMEDADVFVDKNELNSTKVPKIAPRAVGCGWYLMKDKPEYLSASNKCISEGLKAAYGPVTVVSTIANAIFDKEFTFAAKKLLALGVRSNLAGVVATMVMIQMDCAKKMDKKFPGKSNCY